MTEEEWLVSSEPDVMWELVLRVPQGRKMRLWACACSRRIWARIPEPFHRFINLAEHFAEGQASAEELRDLILPAFATRFDPLYSSEDIASNAAEWTVNPIAEDLDLTSQIVADSVFEDIRTSNEEVAKEKWIAERSAHADLIRDIFGNPFRPVTILPECCTSTVLALAQGIYSDRAFDRMPILADALQDAGCSNVDILTHCRQPGEHVRGCWVVDLLTGRQ